MPYNVTTVEEMLPLLDAQLTKMRAETDRNQLKEVSADDAYELGYETAIFDARHYSGDDPRVVKVITIETPSAAPDLEAL